MSYPVSDPIGIGQSHEIGEERKDEASVRAGDVDA